MTEPVTYRRRRSAWGPRGRPPWPGRWRDDRERPERLDVDHTSVEIRRQEMAPFTSRPMRANCSRPGIRRPRLPSRDQAATDRTGSVAPPPRPTSPRARPPGPTLPSGRSPNRGRRGGGDAAGSTPFRWPFRRGGSSTTPRGRGFRKRAAIRRRNSNLSRERFSWMVLTACQYSGLLRFMSLSPRRPEAGRHRWARSGRP